jgi:hypothetical protein
MNASEHKRYLSNVSGIYHYDMFEKIFEHELARSQRYPSPLILLRISIRVRDTSPEMIKSANDTMANVLNRSLRISDVPAYYNDDFLVLLPNTNEMSGGNVAERILINLKGAQNLPGGRLFGMAAYIGLTAHQGGPGISAKILLAEAAVAVNEAATRLAHTFVAFSSLGLSPTKPMNWQKFNR